VAEVAGEHCTVARVAVHSEETGRIMTRTLEQILDEHPDTRGIVVPNADVFFMAREFERRTSTSGIRLMGYDAIEENVRLLKAGYIDFLIGTHPDTQSYSAVHTLYQLVVLKQTPPRRVTQPVEILIRDNIDSYRSTSSTHVARAENS
jgi:LacI family transcriptional regulator